MRPSVSVNVIEPCSESWAAMTPTAAGRHCAACAKTVIDFTAKTDAEILAVLAQPGGACGRFWGHQLQRPLVLPAAPTLPARRWRQWLVAALAAWGLREGLGLAAQAQATVRHEAPHPRKKSAKVTRTPPATQLLVGVVLDSVTRQPLAGAAVFALAEDRHTTTDSAGRFRLRVLAGPRGRHTLMLHLFGYESHTVPVSAAGRATVSVAVVLAATAAQVEVTGLMPQQQRPIMMGGIGSVNVFPPPILPAKASILSHSSLYQWLSRPFRGSKANR